MATDYQAMMDKFQNDPSYMPEIEDDNQPRIKPQHTGVKQSVRAVKPVSNAHQVASNAYQGPSRVHKSRSVSPLNRETVDKATPLLMLLLGIVFMGYSWRGGMTTVTDIYVFAKGATTSNAPMLTGMVLQVILTLGQMVCSTKGWWKGYRAFLLPDAASTAWALNRDFLLDLSRAIITRFDAPAFGVYTVMVIASIFVGVFVARKAESFIIDNYRTLNR